MLRAMVLIDTERLVLRALDMGDVPALFALYSDLEVMRYWSHAPWTSVSQAAAAIREAQQDYASRRSLHLALEHRASRALIGSCALYEFGAHACGAGPAPAAATQGARKLAAAGVRAASDGATLGYLLARQHWGRGYAAEALHALLAYGFGAMGLQQVRAEVAPANLGSMQLLARLGFRSGGIVRNHWQIEGRSCDIEEFTLARGALSVRGKKCA